MEFAAPEMTTPGGVYCYTFSPCCIFGCCISSAIVIAIVSQDSIAFQLLDGCVFPFAYRTFSLKKILNLMIRVFLVKTFIPDISSPRKSRDLVLFLCNRGDLVVWIQTVKG